MRPDPDEPSAGRRDPTARFPAPGVQSTDATSLAQAMLRRRHTLPLALAVALGASIAAQTPTFRTGVRSVPVYVTVQDAGGRLVPDLTKDAFRVLEDGHPVDIALFSRDPQPLSVAIMIDTSQSVAGINARNPRLRDAILAFASALTPGDRASIGTFGMEIAVGANLTSDRRELARVLDEEVWMGGGTPLWQALVAAIASLADAPGRRVVLVITDGVDTGGLPGFRGGQSAVEIDASRTDCMIYAIKQGTRVRHDISADMEHVAENSGGGYVVLPSTGDPADAMARVADELRHQYLLGFVPLADDGRMHRLDVQMTRSGLTPRARRTYVAEAGR
jgi:VWFA-related protein